MTTPTIVPAGFAGDDTDYNKVKRDPTGAARAVKGTVTVPSATAVGAFVGLVPFQKGARFTVGDKSVHITDIDTGTDSLVNLGIIYDSASFTDDVDAFASASTAGQAGGFVAIDEVEGMTLITDGNGWLALENDANITEAEGTVTFDVLVSYDS